MKAKFGSAVTPHRGAVKIEAFDSPMAMNMRADEIERLRSELDEAYATIEQKDETLTLSAKIGKELLESNQELQQQLNTITADLLAKQEDLEQENHDLRSTLSRSGKNSEMNTELEAVSLISHTYLSSIASHSISQSCKSDQLYIFIYHQCLAIYCHLSCTSRHI